MTPFDLLKSPLRGAHLIEAGAGTGKTHAIAGLYVRLILERALPVREILVVTFTLAATAELKDRIRSKLRDALKMFTRQDGRDEFLQALFEACGDFTARREAYERLHAALRDFDEAAIFTIHGFCQRMLHEHAFESGAFFDTELVTDQRRLKEEIVEDFWRKHFYEALPELVGYALNQGFCPASLMSWTGNTALNPDIHVLPDGEPASPGMVRKSFDAFYGSVAALQTLWPPAREDVRQKLQDPALRGNMYNPKTAHRLVTAMDQWLARKDVLLFRDFEKMTPEGIAKAVRKDALPPEHPIFTHCRTVKNKADVLRSEFDRYLLCLKVDLIRMLREELPALKQKQNVLFFDDLLLRLRDALQKDGGKALVPAIRNQFKAALIDEFQDTDPIQYAIFHTVFGREDQILFLIGDPKQAIYSFRGADIFAYMQAAEDIRTGHTLNQNWRSEPGLIAAVNTLFSHTGRPFVYKEISFRPAEAAPAAGRDILSIQGRQEAPLEWWFLPAGPFGEGGRPLAKETARSIIADAVAVEISRLVRLGRAGLALIGQRPLEEGDMAVLVRTNREARLIQQSLRALNIASVLASEENVFDSHEAFELSQVLGAVAWPAHENLVRGALATDMLGANGEALDQWLNDDKGWSVRLETFRQDHDLWETRGFMRMFRTLMTREGIRRRLLNFPDGERRLTNLLHLAEILHQEFVTRRLDSKRLLKWLTLQLNTEEREVRDEHLLRLESDARAVKVLTIHKSKGLEYPVVFCPFAWGSSRIDPNKPFSFHDRTRSRETVLDLGSQNIRAHRISAERERLSENCRLLYVALTRAKHRCYFIWGRINETGSSAPAYLFHAGKTAFKEDSEDDPILGIEKDLVGLSDRDMLNDLAHIAAGSGGTIRLQAFPDIPGTPLPPRMDAVRTLACRKFQGYIDPTWKLASYSFLVSAPAAMLEMPDRDAIIPQAQTSESPARFPTLSGQEERPAKENGKSIFNFPGGVRSGILLHDILDQFDFTERNADNIRSLVAEKLQLHGFDRAWEEILTAMLRKVVDCSLPRPAAPNAACTPILTLSQISRCARLSELEFYFPLQMLSRERLRNLLDGDEWKDTRLERLDFSPVRGFMHGFIDLIFRHEGRFYLLDWKSNVLGPGIESYAPARLRKIMEEHFYGIQSRLYTVALDRYLALRLPDYRYETHFGGIYYLFIRGMDPAWGSSYGVYADRPERRIVEKLSRSLIATE